MSQAQVVTFNPRNGNVILSEAKDLKRSDVVEFDVDAPYTLFTVGAFTKDQPFEGWGIVIKPVAFEAQLTAPKAAKSGEEIDIRLSISPLLAGEGQGERSAFCLLLVYDARLEHESPVPKLAKRIYESVRDATGNLAAGQAPNANDKQWALPGDMVLGAAWAGGPPPPMPVMPLAMAAIPADSALRSPRMMMRARSGASSIAETEAEVPVMVVAPTRMEFPELAYIELFEVEGQASRTVKLGDQIGTWRTRAYVFNDVDYRELTADVQAEKPLYAELDLPAIASVGDEISAAVNYNTREPAELIIATSAGVTRKRVTGSGTERFAINGPGRVEARIENQAESDWTVRDVLWPGKQQVTASRLMILDKGQTARGEKVVIYATMGQVLKDTITALIHYPFG
jgi:hypothetical protein